jgi:DNA polymerase I-like protein with 3'-5' exonuclease and polymerase domains
MLCTLGNEESLGVHDEILLEVPIEATDEVALILKETMEESEALWEITIKRDDWNQRNSFTMSRHWL